MLTPANPDWPAQAGRLIARLRAARREDILALDHVGSTAVPGLDAKDVLDLQLGVADLAAADRIAPLLAEAGFPRWPGVIADNPKPSHPDPADWGKRLHGNADPGRAVNLHVRAAGSPGWRFALCFRDWLRDDADGPGGLPGREAPGGRAARRRTSPPPATRPTRRAGSRTTPRRGWKRGRGARAGSRRRTRADRDAGTRRRQADRPDRSCRYRPKLNQDILSVPGGRLGT